MSRKKSEHEKSPAPGGPRKRTALAVGVIVSAVTLALGAGWLPGLRTSKRAATPPANLSPDAPAKEYIYAGSRLVAVEEAGEPSSGLAAPTGLAAAGGSGSQITVRWSGSAGADHYKVERRETISGEYVVVSDFVTSDTFVDTVTPDRAYLYRVRAADAAGRPSPPSNADLATSVAFSDDPLVSHGPAAAGTTIRADHLNELRRAVNAVRSLAALAPASWSHPDPAPEPKRGIFLADVLELRAGLDAALGALGLQRPYENDPNLAGGYVKAAHFQELRDRVK